MTERTSSRVTARRFGNTARRGSGRRQEAIEASAHALVAGTRKALVRGQANQAVTARFRLLPTPAGQSPRQPAARRLQLEALPPRTDAATASQENTNEQPEDRQGLREGQQRARLPGAQAARA